MQNREIKVPDYEWMAATFNPVRFDAREWVTLAKEAGARYITITARHHDGFSMFASGATRYDIVDWTPFGRDPMRELADECRRQGIKLFFYSSQLDWRHPDYWPRGNTGRNLGRPEAGDWARYLDFMDRQLEELLTNYGPIGGIWFDGMWDKPNADWRLGRTYALIHRLQPAALIVPNHHQAPLPEEDAQTFEQDLPGANTAGFNTTEIGRLPLETSLTMNRSWGFNLTDHGFKSVEDIARYRGGPIPPRPWGVTTHRGDTVFVHVLDWTDPVLTIPTFGSRVTRATLLETGATVEVRPAPGGISLTLPAPVAGQPDRVVVLETRPDRPAGRGPR